MREITSPLGGFLSPFGQRRVAGFSPLSLFASGEQGVWYDPSDLTTLFQDTAGTTPVTSAGQTVAMMLDKSGNGHHATQATVAARPVYQVDAGGRGHLSFDAIDDFLITPTIAPGTGLAAQFFMGVNVAAPQSNNSPIYQYGDSTLSSTDAQLRFSTGDGSTDSYRAVMFGSGINQTPRVSSSTPYTSAFSVLYDALAEGVSEISVRENGIVKAAGSSTDSGLTSFGNSQMTIGANERTTAHFNGNIYSLVGRFGANLDAATIEDVETYIAGKTGVTL